MIRFMTYKNSQFSAPIILIRCPRCKKDRNSKGFRNNPDPKYSNEVCWKCWRQVKYYVDRNKTSENKLRINPADARILVLEYYGSFCACCGETNMLFLQIDHKNNDGAEHRRVLNGLDLSVWIVNNNYPDDFQILCANCNHGKYRNGGVCPHAWS